MKNIADELEKVATKRINISLMNEVVVRLSDVKKLLIMKSTEDLKKAFEDGRLYEAGELELDTNIRQTAFEVWLENNPKLIKL